MRVLGLVALLALLAAPVLVGAEDRVVLRAQPSVKVESAHEGTDHKTLSALEAQEAQVVIEKRAGVYFWTSRGGRLLQHRQTGVYHLFIDAVGAGYIKVKDQSLVPRVMRHPGPRFRYYEHTHLGLGTVTYFGASDSFAP